MEQIDAIIHHARANIPMRNSEEKEGNLYQYLLRQCPKVPGLKEYMDERKYLSPEVNKEILKELYRVLMEDLLSQIKSTEYHALVVDETRDISGKEQLAIILRWVEDNYSIHEDLVGLHQADKTDAESLLNIVTSVLISLAIDILANRGQTFDGAAVLQGAYSGLGARILEINDKAMLTHCLNHNLNLVLQVLSLPFFKS